jgi:predicted alpha/beta-fold hydrolase
MAQEVKVQRQTDLGSTEAALRTSASGSMSVWSPRATEDNNPAIAKFVHDLIHNKEWDYQPATFLKVLPFTNVLHLGMTLVLLELRERRLHLRRRKLPTPQHQVIKLSDGGTICWLEYSPGSTSASATTSASTSTESKSTLSTRAASSSPIVVLLPTFSGQLDYVEQMIHTCVLDFEWTVIVLNRRGTHCPLTTPPLYILGNDNDTKVAFELIRDRFCPCITGGTDTKQADCSKASRRRPLLAIGYSAGASFLMRFLGKFQPDYVTGAVSVSGGFHSEMYDFVPAHLVNALVKAFTDKKCPLSSPVNESTTASASATNGTGSNSVKSPALHLRTRQQHKNEQVAAIRTKMKQMGQAGSMHAFVQLESMLHTPDWKQFLLESGMENWIPKISVPTLVINAEDDIICRNPTAYRRVLTDSSCLASKHCVLVITKQGGHCLFAAGSGGITSKSARQISWADFAGIQFFLRLLQAAASTPKV